MKLLGMFWKMGKFQKLITQVRIANRKIPYTVAYNSISYISQFKDFHLTILG